MRNVNNTFYSVDAVSANQLLDALLSDANEILTPAYISIRFSTELKACCFVIDALINFFHIFFFRSGAIITTSKYLDNFRFLYRFVFVSSGARAQPENERGKK